MAYLRKEYYYRETDIPQDLKAIYAGYDILQAKEKETYSVITDQVLKECTRESA